MSLIFFKPNRYLLYEKNAWKNASLKSLIISNRNAKSFMFLYYIWKNCAIKLITRFFDAKFRELIDSIILHNIFIARKNARKSLDAEVVFCTAENGLTRRRKRRSESAEDKLLEDQSRTAVCKLHFNTQVDGSSGNGYLASRFRRIIKTSGSTKMRINSIKNKSIQRLDLLDYSIVLRN